MSALVARFLTAWAARRLGRRSHVNERERILATARRLRRECGLADDPRLA